MTYSALGTTVWHGYEPVCTAASDEWAEAIAAAMNRYESEGK
jgi:hypothetical protein